MGDLSCPLVLESHAPTLTTCVVVFMAGGPSVSVPNLGMTRAAL